MRDLTQGSIPRNLVAMTVPILVGMLLQTLYFLVDLYFVAQLGEAAIAGVGAAGNINVAVFAVTQMLGVGVVALMSQAVGRKEHAQANSAFNQAFGMSLAWLIATLVVGLAIVDAYMRGISGDPATQAAGRAFFLAFLPGLALQFPMTAMSSALRATGVVKPTMIISALTIVLNIVLAPVLIAGWGTGRPLGTLGAGLASTISIAVGFLLLAYYFHRLEKYVTVQRALLAPKWQEWKRIFVIGFPAGGEFALMFVYFSVIYLCLREVGPAAQAGFGVGSRVMQSVFLPALAMSFAAAPVIGQNYGARLAERVRATFRVTLWLQIVLMVMLAIVCRAWPEALVRPMTEDAAVVAYAAEFLSYIALNFIATGLIFAASSVFQGLGNAWPALLASGTRLVTFVVPALWMSRQPWFAPKHLWWLSAGTVALQAVMSLWLLRGELARKLDFAAAATSPSHSR